jgi:hypothetical protein
MLQRRQTVFLLLALVLLVVAAFNAAFTFTGNDGRAVAQLSEFSLTGGAESNALYAVQGVMLLASAAMSLVAVGAYCNRRFQMRICRWTVFVILVYCAARVSCVVAIIHSLSLAPHANLSEALPIIAGISVVLAYRGIRKDERLVRDSYRIR